MKVLFASSVLAPPDHWYEVPLPVAVTLIDVNAQVSSVSPVLFVMLTVGTSSLGVISIAAVLVQPLSAVAVTV